MIIEIEKYRYEENFWNSRNCLLIDGIECERIDRNHFKYNEEEITLEGNLLTGLILNHNDKTVILKGKIKWYEWIISALFGLLVINYSLYGAIIGGLFGFTNLLFISQVKNPLLKFLISILFASVAFGLCFLIHFILAQD